MKKKKDKNERERKERMSLFVRINSKGKGGRVGFSPPTTAKKKKNPSIEKSLSEPSPPEKEKKEGEAKERKIYERNRGKPRERKRNLNFFSSLRMGNRIRWQRGRLSSSSVRPSAQLRRGCILEYADERHGRGKGRPPTPRAKEDLRPQQGNDGGTDSFRYGRYMDIIRWME